MADVLIHRGEAWEFEWRVQQKNEFSGIPSPIDEDSAVSAWLSETYKGDPILPASMMPLTRRVLELRMDGRVLWFGILDADVVTEALDGIATSTTIYEVLSVDGELKSSPLVVAD